MLRLRYAIERASKRRWVGFFVVLCLAVLFALVIVHMLEHGALGEAMITCLAVALLVVAASPKSTGVSFRAPRMPTHRGPPRLAVGGLPLPRGFRAGADPPRL